MAEAELESEIIIIDVSSGEEAASMDWKVATDTPGTSHGSEDPAKKVGDPIHDDLRHKLNQKAIAECDVKKKQSAEMS